MSSINIRAEQGVLTSVFNDPESLPDVSSKINADDFSEPRYKQIFQALTDLESEGKQASPVGVAALLRDRGMLAAAGGIDEIYGLNDPLSPFLMHGDALSYAGIVREESLRRILKHTAQNLSHISELNSGVTVDAAVSVAQSALTEISERSANSDESSSLADMADDMFATIIERGDNPTGIQGIPTGFIKLDNATSGMTGGQMIVVAGRPGTGKSTIAVDIARNVAFNAGLTVMIFSLEMSRQEIVERILSAQSDVPLSNIRSGQLTQDEIQSLQYHTRELKDVNMIIDDSPNTTIEGIRAKTLAQMKKPEGVDLVVVDYLQLMRTAGVVESRQQEVSAFSRELKLLAKETNRPVVVLSQLNRGPANRQDKRPAASDLRESGSIEQDADVIILLHNIVNEEDSQPVTMLILEKNRQGPNVDIRVNPILECSKFANEEGHYPSIDQAVYTDHDAPPDDGEFDRSAQFTTDEGEVVNRSTGEITGSAPSDSGQTRADVGIESTTTAPVAAFPSTAVVDPTDYGEESTGTAW